MQCMDFIKEEVRLSSYSVLDLIRLSIHRISFSVSGIPLDGKITVNYATQ